MFALSSQLEALAHSIEVQPPQQPPELPPKPSSLINNNHQNSPTKAATIPAMTQTTVVQSPEKLNLKSMEHGDKCEVKYKRLRENQDDEENNEIAEEQGKNL